MNQSAVKTIAVLDDNADDLEMTVMAVEAAGFKPYILESMDSVDEALRQIRENAQALVSDHHLEWADGARFTGAEIVSRCYQEGIPAVLVTGYMTDSNSTIRRFRRGVPELVSRSDLDGDLLATAIETAISELHDSPTREREPHRALVRVDRVNANTGQLDVVVPQWDPHMKIAMPAAILGIAADPDDLDGLKNARFLGLVNTGAAEHEDLYFEGLQPVPGVPDDSELE